MITIDLEKLIKRLNNEIFHKEYYLDILHIYNRQNETDKIKTEIKNFQKLIGYSILRYGVSGITRNEYKEIIQEHYLKPRWIMTN